MMFAFIMLVNDMMRSFLFIFSMLFMMSYFFVLHLLRFLRFLMLRFLMMLCFVMRYFLNMMFRFDMMFRFFMIFSFMLFRCVMFFIFMWFMIFIFTKQRLWSLWRLFVRMPIHLQILMLQCFRYLIQNSSIRFVILGRMMAMIMVRSLFVLLVMLFEVIHLSKKKVTLTVSMLMISKRKKIVNKILPFIKIKLYESL